MSGWCAGRVVYGLTVSMGFLLASEGPPGFTLPDTVRPARYGLDLRIVPDQPTFEGTVRIGLVFSERTSMFWLNAKDLTIHSASIEVGGASRPLRILPGTAETAGFAAAEPIEAGAAQLTIRYTGKLDKDGNEGVYRRKVGDDWYVFTTFTPIEARRAFPCFDEPRFKTPWELTIHAQRDQVALGNSHMLRQTDEPDGMRQTVFAPTLPLASEVVAFAVGPFDIVDAGRAGSKQIPVRIITPRGQAGEAEAARTATPEILARLEAYSGIPYPWDKLDHIAVTKGAYGAVENPGLITYQPFILLAKPGRDTPERQHQMRATMAHELAHQWFGNLVTQASWKDVWLSEGFATWLGTKTVDLEYPPFERTLADNFRLRGIAVSRADASWPVRRSISSREEAKTVYNGLVYSKGAAVLDNLELWLGAARMQRGLHKYLTDHSFGNATVDDLAVALESESGQQVGPVLHSLLDHAGVPVLKATIDCKRIDMEPGGWTYPVCLHWDDGGRQCSVVQPGQKSIQVEAAACPAWIWTNAEGRGLYRTQLNAENLEAVVGGYGQLTEAERRSLVSDLDAMVTGGQIPAAEAMRVVSSIFHEPEARVTVEMLRMVLAMEPLVPQHLEADYQVWLQRMFGFTQPVASQAASIGQYLEKHAGQNKSK